MGRYAPEIRSPFLNGLSGGGPACGFIHFSLHLCLHAPTMTQDTKKCTLNKFDG